MKQQSILKNTLYIVGCLLLLGGLVLTIFIPQRVFSGWLITIGAVCYIISWFIKRSESKEATANKTTNKAKSLRYKRWISMAILSGFFWLITGILLLSSDFPWSVWAIMGFIFYAYSNICLAYRK